MKLSDEERADLEKLLANRPAWFADQVRADVAADERDDTPRTGLSSYTLLCLESELGIM